jgi:7,8-dihydropterin-6-yl-methyl-4-(beta-D-ribofuranosyl)aminobenzene 5'-phosphate synthase
MTTVISTLVENSVQRLGLVAEHGISLLLQTSGGDILFDTGQGFAVIDNAARMKVDLTGISAIVLSHGHRDHTGGLAQVLRKTGSKPLYAHPSAFGQKFSCKSGELRSAGMPFKVDDLEQQGVQFRACSGPTEVVPGVLATGQIPRVTDFEQVAPHFLVKQPNCAEFIQDSLEDDQALIVDHPEAPIVVLGCGHSGIVNTLLYVSEMTGKRRFALVIGGTHLMDADEKALKATVEALEQFEIAKIAPCHCTGFEGQLALRKRFGWSFVVNRTGDRIEL